MDAKSVFLRSSWCKQKFENSWNQICNYEIKTKILPTDEGTITLTAAPSTELWCQNSSLSLEIFSDEQDSGEWFALFALWLQPKK